MRIANHQLHTAEAMAFIDMLTSRFNDLSE